MPLVEAAALASPLALTIAGAVAIDRRREARRRATLNRALHELRRPLHLLALAESAPATGCERPVPGASQLASALAALSDLDAEINGSRAAPDPRPLPAGELADAALRRWRSPALLLGRELELDWRAGGAVVVGDRAALGRALDNLVANSLEHGADRVRIEGAVASGRLRVAVVDTADRDRPGTSGVATLAGPARSQPARGRDPRRGHGLDVVARIAAAHGGRFAFAPDRAGGARAVIELPLADAGAPAAPAGAAA